MEFDHSELRGRMVAKCGSVSALCRELGYQPGKMSKKLVHTGFTCADIVKISDFLEIDQSEIGKYFFTRKVKKSTQEEV